MKKIISKLKKKELDYDLILIGSISVIGLIIGAVYKKTYVFIGTLIIVVYMILNKIRGRYPNES